MSEVREYLNETTEEDLEFVTGGAKVDSSAMGKYKQTCGSHACDCGEYAPAISMSTINICDNCKWARALGEDTRITYCTKQELN